jgi:hypothetical protein
VPIRDVHEQVDGKTPLVIVMDLVCFPPAALITTAVFIAGTIV